MTERRYKLIDYVDVDGSNPDWVLRFSKEKDSSGEVGFRFAWIHSGGKPNYDMNTFIPFPMLFKALAAAADKGMIS